MDKDLISNFTIDGNSKIIVRRNFHLALAMFILGSVYYLLDSADLYFFLTGNNPMAKYNPHFVFYYRIWPLVRVGLIISSIFWYKYFYTAFKYIKEALEKEDAELFYKGNQCFNIAIVLSLIGYSIDILIVGYRLFFTRLN